MNAHLILPCALIALFAPATLAAPTEHPVNTPPEIDSVGVIPIADRQLGCVTLARDAENDPIAFRYQWHVDGEPMPGATSDVFEHHASRGQSIQCEVVPHDGAVEGSARLSPSVQADNQPPTIEMILLMQTPDGMRCQADARDADGDPVKVRYAWSVNDELVSIDGALLPVAVAKGDAVQCFAVAYDAWADSPHEASPRYRMTTHMAAPSVGPQAVASR